MTETRARPLLLDMNGYQWTVLFAAWLGWGFDCFDGLLFNYVAPNCVPTLLGLAIGSPAARAAANGSPPGSALATARELAGRSLGSAARQRNTTRSTTGSISPA